MVRSTLFNKLFLLLPLAYPPTTKPGSDSDAVEWSYDNINNWGIDSPQCNGNRQSPIHLKSSTSYAQPLPAIKFGNYNIPLAGDLTLTNNGHSVELEVPATINGQRPFISGGLMKSKYEAMAVHFHWGSAKSKGSEHLIDDRSFDVEMHIVHKNVKYQTIAEASQHKDGIAVLGVMFKIVNKPVRFYPGLENLFTALPFIEHYGESVYLGGPMTLGHLLGDLNTKEFYTYSGSLTTPNCAEAVTWSVFPNPLPISKTQIKKFWSIREANGKILNNNFRPIQNRNKRPVFYRVTAKI